MKLLETKQGVVVDIYVKPRAREFQLITEEDCLIVSCREPPVKGRVNKELVKELSKFFRANVQIISGQASKQKKILISGVSAAKINDVLLRRCAERK
jgi:uncharacterized protein (TIGR00251 family)